MLIMVVTTTATTVASPDRWKLPTLEWKAPTHPSPAETGGGDAPRPVVRSFRPETKMNVPRIPDFSTALSFESPQWTTTVKDDFGGTGKPEQMRIRKNNDTSLTTDLLDWYHQSTKVTMKLDLSRLLLSILSYRETFYFTPELNPSLLSRGWLMFDSMHN